MPAPLHESKPPGLRKAPAVQTHRLTSFLSVLQVQLDMKVACDVNKSVRTYRLWLSQVRHCFPLRFENRGVGSRVPCDDPGMFLECSWCARTRKLAGKQRSGQLEIRVLQYASSSPTNLLPSHEPYPVAPATTVGHEAFELADSACFLKEIKTNAEKYPSPSSESLTSPPYLRFGR